MGKYKDPAQLIGHAEMFLNGQVGRFLKDIDACRTPGASGKPAYFPALATCVAFMELLTGLYVGVLDPNTNQSGGKRPKAHIRIREYAKEYMWPELDLNTNQDDKSELEQNIHILYTMLRHKVAHLGHPHYVWEEEINEPKSGTGKRITWKVGYGINMFRPLALIPKIGTLPNMLENPEYPPWKVSYTHEFWVDIIFLKDDIVCSVKRYFNDLKKCKDLQENFEKCMNEFFPEDKNGDSEEGRRGDNSNGHQPTTSSSLPGTATEPAKST